MDRLCSHLGVSKRLFSDYGAVERWDPKHLGKSSVTKRLTESDTQLFIKLIFYKYTVKIDIHMYTYIYLQLIICFLEAFK